MLDDAQHALLEDFGALVLRIAVAVPLLAFHGLPKWTSYAEKSQGFPDPLGVGVEMSLNLTIFGELFCAVLLIAGLATRFAGVVIAGMFAVIVFGVHGADPWGEVELAVIYGLGALAVACLGPGRLSFDAVIDAIID